MKSIELVAILIACLNKLASVCNKSFTLAYLFQHAGVTIKGQTLPLNNAATWDNIPTDKLHTIMADQWMKDSIVELLPLKVNVLFCAVVNAKQADRVKIVKAFMPEASDDMIKQTIKLALACNTVLAYDQMTAKEKTPKASKATSTAKVY